MGRGRVWGEGASDRNSQWDVNTGGRLVRVCVCVHARLMSRCLLGGWQTNISPTLTVAEEKPTLSFEGRYYSLPAEEEPT